MGVELLGGKSPSSPNRFLAPVSLLGVRKGSKVWDLMPIGVLSFLFAPLQRLPFLLLILGGLLLVRVQRL